MEEFIAPLGLKVDASDTAKAVVSLDQLAKSAGNAEAATNKLTQQQIAAQKHTAALNQATLNLGRQFSDVGVQLAGGQSPFLILIQQGPQIADALAMAKTQGVGLKAIIVETTVAARGLLVTFAPWIVGLTAIGAAAFVVYDAYQKQAKAIEDTTNRLKEQDKSLGQISPLLSQAKTNADLAADGQRNFDEWIRKTNVSLAEQIRLQRAAALNQTNEAALKAGENLRKAQEEFDRVNRPGPRAGFSTGVGGFSTISAGGAINKDSELYKKAAANLKTAQADLDAVLKRLAQQGQAPDVAFGPQAEGINRTTASIRTATVAVEDYRRAAAINEADLIRTNEEVWPYMAEVVQASEKKVKDLAAAGQVLNKTLGDFRVPDDFENLITDADNAARMARDLRFEIEDLAYAIQNGDWASGFVSLLRVLEQVDIALGKNATSLQKVQALAGIGMGVGSIVGGSTGSAISGAASGALGGAAFAGSKLGTLIAPGLGTIGGALLGGAVGLVGSLFGSSKAKKQAKAQAAAQAAAEEAQRQQTIADTGFALDVALLRAQGKELEAVAKERDKELARLTALSPSLAETQKQLYALEDAASAAAKAAEQAAAVEAKRQSIQDEIDKLTLSSAELLSKQRAKERAEAVALDPALGDLIEKLYGLQDAATASAEAAKAQEQAAQEAAKQSAAAQEAAAAAAAAANDLITGSLNSVVTGLDAAISKFDDFAKSLRDFADSLKADLGLGTTGGSLGQARTAFNTAVSTGDYASIATLGQAYAEAAKASSGSQQAYLRVLAEIRQASLNSASATKIDKYQAGLGASLFGALVRGEPDAFSSYYAKSAAGLPRFANGGSLVLGGMPGVDQNVLSLNGRPIANTSAGEIATFTPAAMGSRTANDNSEIAALREEVAAGRRENAALLKLLVASNDRIQRVLVNVTRDGDAMVTEAAS